jgi:hypothetical protein
MNKDLQYRISSDSNGKSLDGSRNYRFHLPADMPAANFWSVVVYDNQTQLMIQSGQAWPSVHSNSKKIGLNSDNSLDVWFGPEIPEGREYNWVQTIRGKNWHMVLRLYDLVEPLTDQAWSPGEVLEII